MHILDNLIRKKERRAHKADGGTGGAAGQMPETTRASAGRMQGQNASAQPDALDRRAFDRIVAESLRGGHKGGCLLLCDVDRYREIKAIYGKETGDAVLRHVCDALHGVFGAHVCVGCLGGDRFALWLPTAVSDSADAIGRGVGIVNDRLLHPGRELPPVSVSAGAAFGRADDDHQSIGKRAYQALTVVKENGSCGFEAAL